MRGIKIDSHKTNDKKISIFNKTKYIYIPLASGNDRDITLLVKKGEYVYKGTMIGKRKGNFRIGIHSSVSGIVTDFCEKTYLDGNKVKCVVIENDFKEKIKDNVKPKKDITKYTKEEFIEILKDTGIIGMGGAGFPTYFKYDTNKKMKTLVVNCVECEPFITCDVTLVKAKCEEILEAIDAILTINSIDEAIIAVKKTNEEIINTLNNYVGTYLNIKIKEVPDLYPMGWEKNVVEVVTGNTYIKYPGEIGVIVSNIGTIYAIYEALKLNKPLIERVVTIAGDKIKKPVNLYMKTGTITSDIIEELKIKGEYVIVAGGPMTGKMVDSNYIIAPNSNCILFLDKKCYETETCLNCGKCVNVCPAKLSPVLIMKNRNNEQALKPLQPAKCIECGLCTYICPSKILVREFVKDAKDVIK